MLTAERWLLDFVCIENKDFQYIFIIDIMLSSSNTDFNALHSIEIDEIDTFHASTGCSEASNLHFFRNVAVGFGWYSNHCYMDLSRRFSNLEYHILSFRSPSTGFLFSTSFLTHFKVAKSCFIRKHAEN